MSVRGVARSVEVRRAKAAYWRLSLLPVIRSARAEGVTTLQGLADYLNSRGITTIRGAEWRPMSVARLFTIRIDGNYMATELGAKVPRHGKPLKSKPLSTN